MTTAAKDLIADTFTKTVVLDTVHSSSVSRLDKVRSQLKQVLVYLAKVAKFLLRWLMQPENWMKKRTWIGAFILLRAAYVTMNEYGKNPFKKSLSKDHVFLTGAGGGIGRLMAIRFGKLGCKLSLSDVNKDGLEETKAQCEKNGVMSSNIAIFICDVSSKESITAGAEVARAAHGPVSILVNNAGIVSGLMTQDLTEKMIEKTMQINTVAHLHTIKEFLPGMIQNKRGHIVTIASMAGLAGVPGLSDYCASKYGAVAIDESVRLELQAKKLDSFIKTTCICPYLISTGMFSGANTSFPFNILNPVEVADRILAAVQQEEQLVVIPWRGNMIYLAKLMPVSWTDSMLKAMGVHDQMSDFKGKGSMESRIPGLNK